MISVNFYGTVDDATAYFANRLHESAWTSADPADRPKALWAATQIIDTLNFAVIEALKDPATHRIMGTSFPRIDIPAKVTGGAAYVVG